jgi:hypothetical protein
MKVGKVRFPFWMTCQNTLDVVSHRIWRSKSAEGSKSILETRTVVSKVPQAPQKAQMVIEVVGRLLEANFPATLCSGPFPCAFVFPNLVFQGRRQYHGRYTLHSIRFIEMSVDFMYPVVILLKAIAFLLLQS